MTDEATLRARLDALRLRLSVLTAEIGPVKDEIRNLESLLNPVVDTSPSRTQGQMGGGRIG